MKSWFKGMIIGVLFLSPLSGGMLYLQTYQFDTQQGEPLLPVNLMATEEAVNYYLVQLAGAPLREWKDELKASGVEVIGYIPSNAYIVRMDKKTKELVSLKPFVTWIGLWHPAYKIHPKLADNPGEMKVTILLFSLENLPETVLRIERLGGRIIRTSDGAFKIIEAIVVREMLVSIANIKAVHWIEPRLEPRFYNDYSSQTIQSGNRIAAGGDTIIWKKGLRGEGQILSTADSGITTGHWQFYDSAYPIAGWGNYISHRKVIAYVDGSLGGGAVFGDDPLIPWHGTHTAGTVCGEDAYNGGTSIYDGVAKNAKLYFCDIGNNAGGLAVPADLTNLYLLPYNGNAAGAARIMSNSWGWDYEGDYATQDAQTDNFMWNRKNFLIIFSQGNDPPNTYVGSCAVAKNVIAVGATGGTDPTGLNNYLTEGPADDQRKKPELMAMGGLVGVAGAQIMSANGGTSGATSAYVEKSGTSMASPAVNGACGLIRQYLNEGWYPTGIKTPANAIPNPSAALIKTMALVSTDPNIGPLAIPNDSAGWGRMDLDSVLYFAGDTRKLLLHDSTTGGLNTNDSVDYQWTVNSAIPLRVTLCWTDTAGNPAVVARNLVNDLDLRVISPSASSYWGNNYVAGQSSTGGTYDSLNTAENFRLNAPGIGTWTAWVRGRTVPTGANQPYAIVITGDVSNLLIGIKEEKSASYVPSSSFNINSTLVKNSINFSFQIAKSSKVETNLYNILGSRVYYENRFYTAGIHKKEISLSSLPQGIYFLIINFCGETYHRKIISIK